LRQRKNRQTSFVIDGEAVLLGVDGISDFNGLHSRKYDHEVQLHAFEVLALDGDDLRNCRCPCARPIWPVCWRADRRAFSSAISSRARSAPTYSARPANLERHRLRAVIVPTAAAIARLDQGQEPKYPAIERVKEAFA
jgi:hypothetical protein